MPAFTCCIWWFVFGVLLGWLLNWLLSRLFSRGARVKIARPRAPSRRAHAPPASAGAVPPGAIDYAAARAVGFELSGPDQLEIIEGIGAKIADLLRANGVKTFAQLAGMERSAIQTILNKGGPNFKFAEPDTWAEQADLAARNRWQELKGLQERLYGGIRPPKPKR